MNKGTLYIISAASGTGKTSLVRKLVTHVDNLVVSVSHTTRQKRLGEVDGLDYFFVDTQTFHTMQSENAFLECAQVFDNFYGTAQKTVEDNLEQGQDVILEIDWQGAQQVRQRIPDCISIFVLPPSIEILKQRLEYRGQDNEAVIKRRMEEAVMQISHYPEFDYLIVNDDFDFSLRMMKNIVISNRFKQVRQASVLQPLLADLLS